MAVLRVCSFSGGYIGMVLVMKGGHVESSDIARACYRF